MPASVLPVSAAGAFLWARGEIGDRDLLLKYPSVPEMVFVLDLPARSDWRECLRLCANLHAQGAVGLIARSGTASLIPYMIKRGCVATFHEPTNPPKDRFILGPEHFQRWIASVTGRPVTFPAAPNIPPPLLG